MGTTKKLVSKPKIKARPAPGTVDPKVSRVIEAFLADRRLAPIAVAYEESANAGRRSFGSNGLKVGGKLFALFTQGTLVVKLSKARVAVLVEEGIGVQFDPGHGRLMKEWLAVKNPDASWVDLAREAHDHVKGAR